jgi:hypothetical protein
MEFGNNKTRIFGRNDGRIKLRLKLRTSLTADLNINFRVWLLFQLAPQKKYNFQFFYCHPSYKTKKAKMEQTNSEFKYIAMQYG